MDGNEITLLHRLRPDVFRKLSGIGIVESANQFTGPITDLLGRIQNTTNLDEVLIILLSNQETLLTDHSEQQISEMLEHQRESEGHGIRFLEFIYSVIVVSRKVGLGKTFNWIKGNGIPNSLLPIIDLTTLVNTSAESPSIARRVFETQSELQSPLVEAISVILNEFQQSSSELDSPSKNGIELLRQVRRQGIQIVFSEPTIDSSSLKWLEFLSGQLAIAMSWSGLRNILQTYPETLSPEIDALLQFLIEQARSQHDAISMSALILQRTFLQNCKQLSVE